jgi:hypothetical protein
MTKQQVIMLLAVLGLMLTGCSAIDGLPPEPDPPFVVIEDMRSDGEFGKWRDEFISGGTWADLWFVNQYERPFTAGEMGYQPHLDIHAVRLRSAGAWTIYEIETAALPGEQTAYLAIEFDLDLDDRPDLLIQGWVPEYEEWGQVGIKLFQDENRDVGGNRPRLAEPREARWDGFELESRFEQQADAPQIYLRKTTDTPATFQIAVHRRVLERTQTYVWRAWLEAEEFKADWFEYHDQVSLEEAGSPYRYSEHYPIDQLASVDNTCLHLVGGQLDRPMPGFCGTLVDVPEVSIAPPDDLYTSSTPGGDPILVTFPSGEAPSAEVPGTPSLASIPPGLYFFPTPTPALNPNTFPVLDVISPPLGEPSGPTLVVEVETPEQQLVVAPYEEPEELIYSTPDSLINPEPTMFDPFQGSPPTATPTPTDMFDPNQGSVSTLVFPTVRIQLPTPTPTLYLIWP